MTRPAASTIAISLLLACSTSHAQAGAPAPPSLVRPSAESSQQPPSATPSEALATAEALGTDFSYQGQLLKSGQLYSGSADFLFRLYDAATGGVQVGSDVTVTGLTVTNGLFATQLDFGSVFDGSKRWLAVHVRTPGDAGYTELTPRRPVSAAPYALRAINGPAGASQWLNDPNGINHGGPVGIGTASHPQWKLWVNSGSASGNPIHASNDNPNYSALFTRNYAAGGYGWIDDTSYRHWITGRLGLGVNAAEYPLDVMSSGATARIVSSGSSLPYPGEGVRAALFVHGNTGGGPLGRSSIGIYASSTNSRAVSGWSTTDWGVDGNNTTSGCYGVLGTLNEGVLGVSTNVSLPAAKFFAPTNGVAIEANGLVKAKTLQILGGADLAEPFDVSATRDEAAAPGTVVVIDEASPGDMRVSDRAYDTRVAGVISGANGLKPGMVMQAEGDEQAGGEHPVALTGRVWTKVDASFGAVRPGDLLTTSPTLGHAMRADDPARRPGAVIGKAMTSLEDGRGLVLVLVSLQ